MDKMGKQFSQIINKNNLKNKINKITNKDNLYAIEKNIENLSGKIKNIKIYYTL